MSVTMAALVGASLAPVPWMSTIPYGFQFLAVMLTTYPASRLMSAIGRKPAFLLATIPLAAAGISGFLAVERGSFLLLVLVLAPHLLGTYIAVANFNRFAATDGMPAELKPGAISLVVAGGVIAAIIGPLLTVHLKDIQGLNDLGISVLATWGAFSPSLLFSWLGWQGTNVLSIGLCLVLLALSAAVLNPYRRVGT